MKSKPPNKRARLDPQASPSEKLSPGKASTSATTTSELLATTNKIKAVAATSSVGTSASVNHSPSPMYPLNSPFPNITTPDLNKEYPKTSVLFGGQETGLTPIEDLDAMQTELETLLCSVSLRIRVFDRSKRCLKSLPTATPLSSKALGEHYDQSHQDKINAIKNIMDSGHGTRTSVSAAAKLVMGSQLPVKTHGKLPSLNTPALSPITGSSRKSNNSASAATIGPIKLQPKKKVKVESLGGKRNEKPARALQNRTMSTDDSGVRHEVPNQFWEFTDSYCRDITNDDINNLEKLIESHKSIPKEVFEIPPLGKFYRDGYSSDDAGKNHKNHQDTKSKSICGPLTQRLVSALVDDRVSNYIREDPSDGFFINRPGLIKALGLDSSNGISDGPPLEARLRQVLLEQGLLQDDEDPALTDDEIMAEIKRTQNTLTKLHNYNSDKLDEILALGKKEQIRLSVKSELDKADNDVIEAYRMITACRQKKKPLTKKERDTAAKVLQNRKAVLDKLAAATESSEPEIEC